VYIFASGSLHHFKDSITVVCNSSSGEPFLVLSCVKTFIGLDAGDGNPSTGINDLPNPFLLHILTTSLDEVTWLSDDWTYWA
jgi:hypothetical protein